MPRKESETVPEGNGPTPQDAYKEESRRVMSEMGEVLEEITEDLRSMNQRIASLEQDARQPRLAMEADGQADTKTGERTEGAAKAVQAMHGDSFSASRVGPDPKTTSTSLGVKTDPPALPFRDEVLVENRTAAPKLCLSPLEMRSPTAADSLLLAGETFMAAKTTFDHPTLWFCLTE